MNWCNINTTTHESKNAVEWYVNDRYTIITTAIEMIKECISCSDIWNCDKRKDLVRYLDEDVKN
jgi:hypothetical protein